jgi:hypothetical protein
VSHRIILWKNCHQRPGTRVNSVGSAAQQIVSLLLVAMLQWATVLAVCPGLHELIHHDADDEHHDCVVTLFLAGQVEQPAIDPIVIANPVVLPAPLDQSSDTRSFGSFFLSCRMLEHAPPLRN